MGLEIGDMVAFWENSEKFVVGIIVEIVSTDRGLSGYKGKTYFSIDWMHPDYKRSDMIDLSTVTHYAMIYATIVRLGLL